MISIYDVSAIILQWWSQSDTALAWEYATQKQVPKCMVSVLATIHGKLMIVQLDYHCACTRLETYKSGARKRDTGDESSKSYI